MPAVTVGSMFAGIGGAELAIELALPQVQVLWQNDLILADVRAKHWPEARQIVGDVREVDPTKLPTVDILTAGFPCQDLSLAGGKAGLDGARSGLYREVLRFAAALRPRYVLMENVHALLKHMPRLSVEWAELGYGLSWTVCTAAQAGRPHLRKRVFVLAARDAPGFGLVETWPWYPMGQQDGRLWPTPTARDHKTGELNSRNGGESLSNAASGYTDRRGGQGAIQGTRLNPEWVEALMGYPLGWTAGEVKRGSTLRPVAVRGRYPADWDRSVPWPGLLYEPPRTLPPGPPVRGRRRRIEALGNAWCPQQGAMALESLLREYRAQMELAGMQGDWTAEDATTYGMFRGTEWMLPRSTADVRLLSPEKQVLLAACALRRNRGWLSLPPGLTGEDRRAVSNLIDMALDWVFDPQYAERHGHYTGEGPTPPVPVSTPESDAALALIRAARGIDTLDNVLLVLRIAAEERPGEGSCSVDTLCQREWCAQYVDWLLLRREPR